MQRMNFYIKDELYSLLIVIKNKRGYKSMKDLLNELIELGFYELLKNRSKTELLNNDFENLIEGERGE